MSSRSSKDARPKNSASPAGNFSNNDVMTSSRTSSSPQPLPMLPSQSPNGPNQMGPPQQQQAPSLSNRPHNPAPGYQEVSGGPPPQQQQQQQSMSQQTSPPMFPPQHPGQPPQGYGGPPPHHQGPPQNYPHPQQMPLNMGMPPPHHPHSPSPGYDNVQSSQMQGVPQQQGGYQQHPSHQVPPHQQSPHQQPDPLSQSPHPQHPQGHHPQGPHQQQPPHPLGPHQQGPPHQQDNQQQPSGGPGGGPMGPGGSMVPESPMGAEESGGSMGEPDGPREPMGGPGGLSGSIEGPSEAMSALSGPMRGPGGPTGAPADAMINTNKKPGMSGPATRIYYVTLHQTDGYLNGERGIIGIHGVNHLIRRCENRLLLLEYQMNTRIYQDPTIIGELQIVKQLLNKAIARLTTAKDNLL